MSVFLKTFLFKASSTLASSLASTPTAILSDVSTPVGIGSALSPLKDCILILLLEIRSPG